MHPLLPAATAADRAHCAAVGLGRHGHTPGVVMIAMLESAEHNTVLEWSAVPVDDHIQLDRHRVTEDAAEAISLALVHVAHGWVVRRRLARGEAADWLLDDPEQGLVALEVSGIDEGVIVHRLRDKLLQASRATAAPRQFASVVEFATPRAELAPVQVI
jgi:hypothetical protein